MQHALRNFLLTLNYLHPAAMAVAVRRGPRAASRYLSEIYRCSKTDAGRYLPVVTLDSIAPTQTEFVVVRHPDWGGSLTMSEISSLCHLVAARRPRKILEIGTFRGLTTLNLALNAPEAEIHTVDLPPDINPADTQFKTNDNDIIARRGGYFYAGRPEASHVLQHYGDTASFDFSAIGTGVELCLIDAAHSYEYVSNDTRRVLPYLSDDALILWHDYGRNDFLAAPRDAWGVSRFLHEISDVGVGVLQGTSIGCLVLSPDKKNRLERHLDLSTTEKLSPTA